MIASRKLERLQNTANELQQYLPATGTAELDFMECNIRNESQVMNGACVWYYSLSVISGWYRHFYATYTL